ncbi:hypothetical protein L2E82_29581 [Cichorium intybus]|uniref:Uncharacterized protein n=1 Tax=Cichorium intybus TaxID=13427 RepID=A0ACB9CYB9_CICIN|nr:hypothetical protein L2E82_29581 [Cichorium intybus]
MAIEGFKAQSEMVSDTLDRLITSWEARKESVIVEGVHLSLNFVKIGITILVIKRLVKLLNWKDPQEEEIRMSAEAILESKNHVRIAAGEAQHSKAQETVNVS